MFFTARGIFAGATQLKGMTDEIDKNRSVVSFLYAGGGPEHAAGRARRGSGRQRARRWRTKHQFCAEL